jgi:Zn-dependent M16 (insulinase) family peptidase
LGVWNVAQRLISYDYLWNEVRVKGGAYGTGERRTQSGILTFWSYRDPGIDGTLERYGRAGDWLAAWEASEAEMDGYVVSTVANHDAPVKPSARARRQDTLFFSNRDVSWRNEVRSQELACTEDDLRALSDTLKHLAANHYVCVFGPREIIEASNVTFDRVCDLLG